MHTTNIKSIGQRFSLLGAAAALVIATIIPALAYADSLNPLTERSLLLSSSAPGFQDTDGSGNSNDTPPDSYTPYAPAGSGPNGMKTGETFTFRVSSDSTGRPIKGMSFQYCTTAAGFCFGPGNNNGDADVDGDGDVSDSTRIDNATAKPLSQSDLDTSTLDGATAGTDFKVYIDLNNDGDFEDVNEDVSTGWTLETSNVEDHDAPAAVTTGKDNFIRILNATGVEPIAGAKMKIEFIASASRYITNPGSDAFFVKINTYDSEVANDQLPTTDANIIDGGVTVANVMTDSIHITTKVLETMQFSVGVRNPDTLDEDVTHGICDPIKLGADGTNRLNIGNSAAEWSLETDTAYDAFSYWRLSSNSSGGATVYYSGETLSNTVGDNIDAIGTTAENSHPGTEQFGLRLVDAGADAMDNQNAFDSEWVLPTLTPLIGEGAYTDFNGTTPGEISNATTANNAKFAFDPAANTIPALLAQESDDVINCATAKVRYVANIAANTPAGVYTTKINYLAAPQY